MCVGDESAFVYGTGGLKPVFRETFVRLIMHCHSTANFYTPLLPILTETHATNCTAYSAGVVW